jgi:hypothetical protein
VSEETRKNLLALAIAFGVVALVVAFVLRPGVVLPTTETAVANSVAGEAASLGDRVRESKCFALEAEGAYGCGGRIVNEGYPLHPPTGARRFGYVVTVDWAGCWTAQRLRGGREARGCISLLDY